LRDLLLLLALCFLITASTARAGFTYTQPQLYWLTNSVGITTNGYGTFSLTTGALTNLPSSIITNNSAPFPLVRDRGFALYVGEWCPTLSAWSSQFVFQFATPFKVYTNTSGGYYWVTNWNNLGMVTNTFAFNQPVGLTNELYGYVNNSGAAIQNATMARLWEIINPAGGTNFLDPTNTFVAITP
jgi:hypothetical protein